VCSSVAIEQLAERWALTVGARFPPTPGTPNNFVAPAVTKDSTRVVLKVSRYVDETRSEIEALRLWEGVGAVRLLEAEPDLGALLLERIEPGTMLAETTDDDETVRVAASVLRQLWQPLPAEHALNPLDAWLAAFGRNRDALRNGAGGFPAALFERADDLRQHLLASTSAPVALHGDLHHFNVLRSSRAEWLAIDPKGLAGDRCFDVCQFLKNPGPVSADVNRRRIDIFCAELGLERRRVSQWCLVDAVLDACWTYEDGDPMEPAIEYATEASTY
jgi:streptomycin 6-kinase